ncbi:MAG: nuclear transport factor 2 family protein [Saprospiraceae bacterium]
MKVKFTSVVLLFAFVLNGQTPAKPRNPFPGNKNKTTTPAPVPPPSQQTIPPSTQPAPGPSQQTIPPSTQSSLPANTSSTLPPITGTDKEQIISTIFRVFDGMRLSDTGMMRPLFAPTCRLYTPVTNSLGQAILNEETLTNFFKAVSTPRKEIVDERILNNKIDIDGSLAQVWADYNLYVDNKFIHCGVDVFQLYKSNTGWKIFELADTRRTTGCGSDPKDDVASILDKWHVDAATANADAYFGAMTADGVFLGTDPTERWTREEFRAWAKSAFDAKKTWNFKASKRFVSFNQDQTIAWFDEELTTWMGTCRGSGVLLKTSDGWKIKQYNLTILVPNEKVQDYLRVIGK